LDHQSLVVLLRRLALASVPLVSASCGPVGGTCNNPSHEKTVSVASLLGDAGALDGGAGDGGLEDLCRLAAGPGQNVVRCQEVTQGDGKPAVFVVYVAYCLGGRRPAGLATTAPNGPTALGSWLARMAHLEAASVDAFEILASELEVHGAPRALVEAARASASDERRHARLMARLALAEGTHPEPARIERHPTRELEAIARENAVEGCVRETFGALLAWRQAVAAEDAEIRATMASIAPDEARHAALSWQIDAWARERLPAAARRRVEAARAEAAAELVRDAAVDAPADVRAAAGLPQGDTGRALASALFARLA
jgi:hypothetical protein